MTEHKKRKRQRDGRSFVSRMEIFKYVTAFAVLVYVVLLLIYAGGSTKAFDTVAKAVEDGITSDNLLKQKPQALKRYYGLNSADYEGVLLYTSKSSTSAEEVLLIKVKTDDQAGAVREAVWERLKSRKDRFAEFAPEQVKVLEKAQVLVRGRFVFAVVSPEAADYSDIFTKSL